MGARAVIGDWYLTRDETEKFEVVALDDDAGTIDVQFFDGSIGEFDLETWEDMQIGPCAAPEDCSGVYEMEFDEIDDTDESAYLDEDDFDWDGLQVIHEKDFDQGGASF